MVYIRHKFLDINIIAQDLVSNLKKKKGNQRVGTPCIFKKLKIMNCNAPCIIVIILKNYESIFPKIIIIIIIIVKK